MPASKNWTLCNINNIILRIVARTTSRIFIGEEYCRDEEWLAIATDYTVAAFEASYAIKKWPPLLRPFVYRFLSPYRAAVRYSTDAKNTIVPIVASRLRGEELMTSGKEYDKPYDLLQWLLDGASASERRDPDFMTREQLQLSLVAIHTTTMAVVNALYEIAARLEYVEPLREELRTVLQRTDGHFTKSTLDNLKKLDSFMKESHRHNPSSFGMLFR